MYSLSATIGDVSWLYKPLRVVVLRNNYGTTIGHPSQVGWSYPYTIYNKTPVPRGDKLCWLTIFYACMHAHANWTIVRFLQPSHGWLSLKSPVQVKTVFWYPCCWNQRYYHYYINQCSTGVNASTIRYHYDNQLVLYPHYMRYVVYPSGNIISSKKELTRFVFVCQPFRGHAINVYIW